MAEQFEHVNASANTWSPCSVATYEAQIGDYECLAHGITAACGNGIVDENEECDCGGDDCSAIDPCCDGSTCQLKNQTCAPAPATAPPPPAYYQQDPICTSGCGVGYDIGVSQSVINVRADQCLQCSGGHGLLGSPAGYRESDCKLDAAPYKGWKYSGVEPNEDEGFRYEDCHWSGCGGDATPQAARTRQRPRRAPLARTRGVARRLTFGFAAACWTATAGLHQLHHHHLHRRHHRHHHLRFRHHRRHHHRAQKAGGLWAEASTGPQPLTFPVPRFPCPKTVPALQSVPP